MSRGIPTTVICGEPMTYYELRRPRDDYQPVCHRSPHDDDRHMSRSAVEHARESARARRRRRQLQRAAQAVLSDPPASVIS